MLRGQPRAVTAELPPRAHVRRRWFLGLGDKLINGEVAKPFSNPAQLSIYSTPSVALPASHAAAQHDLDASGSQRMVAGASAIGARCRHRNWTRACWMLNEPSGGGAADLVGGAVGLMHSWDSGEENVWRHAPFDHGRGQAVSARLCRSLQWPLRPPRVGGLDCRERGLRHVASHRGTGISVIYVLTCRLPMPHKRAARASRSSWHRSGRSKLHGLPSPV